MAALLRFRRSQADQLTEQTRNYIHPDSSRGADTAPKPPGHRNRHIVVLYNDTNDYLPPRSILRLSDLEFVDQVFEAPVMTGQSPVTGYPFAILTTGLARRESGAAVVSGVAEVNLHIPGNGSWYYADCKDGDTTQLIAQETYGPARVLYREPGLGTRKAVVVLGIGQVETGGLFQTDGLGISAAIDATTPGSGLCTQMDFNGSAITPRGIPPVVVYNMIQDTIAAYTIIQAKKIGRYWFADVEPCL